MVLVNGGKFETADGDVQEVEVADEEDVEVAATPSPENSDAEDAKATSGQGHRFCPINWKLLETSEEAARFSRFDLVIPRIGQDLLEYQ